MKSLFWSLSDSGDSQKSTSSESVDEFSASLNNAFVTVTFDPIDHGKWQTLVPYFIDLITGLGVSQVSSSVVLME